MPQALTDINPFGQLNGLGSFNSLSGYRPGNPFAERYPSLFGRSTWSPMNGGWGQGAGLRPQEPTGVQIPKENLSQLASKLGSNAWNTGLLSKLPSFLSNKGGGGLAQSLASKGGLLGKLGQGAAKNPTPWALGGTAAGILGDLISKKHAKTGGFIGGAGKGAATGAMIGSVVPGIGTAIGGVVGGLIGGIKGLFGGKKKLDEKKKAEAAAKANLGAFPSLGKGGSWQEQNDMGIQQALGMNQYGMSQPSAITGIMDRVNASMPQQLQDMQKKTYNYGSSPYNTGDNMTSYGNFGA